MQTASPLPLANPYTSSTVRASPPHTIRSYSPLPVYATPSQQHPQTYNFMNEDSSLVYRPQTVYAPVDVKPQAAAPLVLRQQAAVSYQPQYHHGLQPSYGQPAARHYPYGSQ